MMSSPSIRWLAWLACWLVLQELQSMLARWQLENGDPLALNPETPG